MEIREKVLLDGAIPDNTKKNRRWAMKKLEEYMKGKNKEWDSTRSKEDLKKDLIDFFTNYENNDSLKNLNNDSFKQVLLGIAGEYSSFKIMSSDEFDHVRKIVNGCIVERKGNSKHKPKRDILEKEEILTLIGKCKMNDSHDFLELSMFVMALVFALRVESELTYLEFSQFKIVEKQKLKGLEFYPGEDKNHKEGLKGKKNPTRYVYAIDEEWCPVKIFELLSERKDPTATRLFCKPLKKKNGNIWYSKRPIGKNKIQEMLQQMVKNKLPQFDGNFSGHSIRASTVSIMCAEGLSDFRIMSRTGHSSKAVDDYKRTIPTNLKEETEILLSSSPAKKRKVEKEKETRDPKNTVPLILNNGTINGNISIVFN